jgi:hypothetical protein
LRCALVAQRLQKAVHELWPSPFLAETNAALRRRFRGRLLSGFADAVSGSKASEPSGPNVKTAPSRRNDSRRETLSSSRDFENSSNGWFMVAAFHRLEIRQVLNSPICAVFIEHQMVSQHSTN